MTLAHAAAGILAAAVVAALARRAGSLSTSGAVAATAVGGAAMAAGWRWGLLLVAYFAASVALSRYRAGVKAARTGSVVEKGGRRDAVQVLANGGVFALLALVAGDATLPLAAAAVGALAGATADTWATEVGTLAEGRPRSLLGFHPVPPGTSGGISLPGTAALVAGAAFVALLARALRLTPDLAPMLAGGVAGAAADSLLGATLQERRRCPACDVATERRVHDCGTPTLFSGGLAWLDNDAVNAAATVVGAATAAVLAA